MTQIAHLTDMHLIEDDHGSRRGAARLRLAYLSLARPRKAEHRRSKAARALLEARLAGADHLVITGDLTEDGVAPQFEVLAEVLEESRWPASQVTLVPGNHDAYESGDGFAKALAGPLRAYAETSAPGAMTVLRDAVLVAVSTAFHQPVTRSAGAIEKEGLQAAERAAREARRLGRALVIAQHHPPRRHAVAPLQWIDGLREHAELGALLREHDHAHVLHGHTHEASDRSVRSGASPRIFSAEAVVDSAAPLRFYRAEHGRLRPELSALPRGISSLAVA